MGQGRFIDDDLAAIRDRASLTELLRGKGLELRRAGGDSLKALCPFHEERTPSFHVTPSRGLWYCHGCGEGGDVIAFLQRAEQLNFPEAVRALAESCGVSLQGQDPGDAPTPRARILDALAAAHAYFRASLATPAAAPAVELLQGRHFTRADSDAAGCGFAPPHGGHLLDWLNERGHSTDDAIRAGLARVSDDGAVYPFFRNRLLWPVHDTSGRVIGFGARRLADSGPGSKYVNTPETAVYRKSEVLYGWPTARKAAAKAGRLYIVEGYTDVMAAIAAGVPETVATCGTAFSEGHLRLITRTLPDDVRLIFTFDGDAAGRKATTRAWHVAAPVLNRAYVVAFSAGTDPCTLRQEAGDDALLKALSAPRPMTLAVVDDLIEQHLSTEDTPEAKSRAAAAVGALLAGVPDVTIAEGYAQAASHRLGATVSVAAAAEDPPPALREEPQVPAGSSGPAQRSTMPPVVTRTERLVLHRLITSPAAAAAHAATLDQGDFPTPPAATIVGAVIAAATTACPTSTTPVTVWYGAIHDQLPDQAARAQLAQLAADPTLESSAADEAVLGVGLATLELHRLIHQARQARSKLLTTAGADQDAAADHVIGLDQKIGQARARLADAQRAALT